MMAQLIPASRLRAGRAFNEFNVALVEAKCSPSLHSKSNQEMLSYLCLRSCTQDKLYSASFVNTPALSRQGNSY
ncbi:hypothetical protein SUGI_0230470 [Cryptomeria japonica]|nr:hypothetical protein SUGI_0230470 [Cryptomeria japonica]